MAIPMPGHAVPSSETENVKKDVERLTELIHSHDVIYILMDSRESRWLPTLLCSSLGKVSTSIQCLLLSITNKQYLIDITFNVYLVGNQYCVGI